MGQSMPVVTRHHSLDILLKEESDPPPIRINKSEIFTF